MKRILGFVCLSLASMLCMSCSTTSMPDFPPEPTKRDFACLMAYSGVDLFKLDIRDTWRCMETANRVVLPKYWPAFVAQLRDSQGQEVIVYVECSHSQHYPPGTHSDIWIRTSVFEKSSRWRSGHPTEIPFGHRATVGRFEVIENPLGTKYGELLTWHFYRGHGGFSGFDTYKDFYTVRDEQILFVRREDEIQEPVSVMYDHGGNRTHYNPSLPIFDEPFTPLQSQSTTDILMALVFLTAHHTNWSQPKAEEEHNKTLRQVYGSLILRKLLKHRDAWVRDYAALFIRLMKERELTPDSTLSTEGAPSVEK